MASITPDPKKRGYLLPPGCKDLIDVLQGRDRRKIRDLLARKNAGVISRTAAGKLSDIERYVKMVFTSSGPLFTVWISPPDELLSVDVGQAAGRRWARLLVRMGSEIETDLRHFFLAHGLSTPNESTIPDEFCPDLPVDRFYDVSPMPDDPASLASLLAECFRQVRGLTDASHMNFRHDEITKLPPPS